MKRPYAALSLAALLCLGNGAAQAFPLSVVTPPSAIERTAVVTRVVRRARIVRRPVAIVRRRVIVRRPAAIVRRRVILR